ncbi:hypothetical protein PLEOSDRAFT_171232 [Pleurotus ostreatus PC15]|uniref:Diacetyl reductase [(S)-acetoin forming] n=1 Tax=Pleurotus ostreatus (strain PC15) TaxID=1137138 RepID=A0A067NH56_PLEO1|nr:hypothetical protein PLEOSDRAFT_171232 [Pleurotus ostreatus PC15]
MSDLSLPSQSKGVAIITGAAQGLGRAIALRLASDGFDVALNDIPAKAPALEELVNEIKAGAGTNSERRAIFVPGSVAKEDDVMELVARTVRELGGLDVMVANAGVALNGFISDTSVEDWDALYAVNVRGTFLCYKHAADAMIKQGRGGRIVGACSIAGKKGFPDSPAYSSSKFAVRGLTQSAAQEYGKYGITVNAYAPGSIVTELLGKFDAYNVKKQGLEPGQWTESLKNRAALGKLLTPTDIANLVSFIVSKNASFITGQSVSGFRSVSRDTNGTDGDGFTRSSLMGVVYLIKPSKN